MLYITKIVIKAVAIVLSCLEAHPPGENAGDQKAAINVHGQPLTDEKTEWLTVTVTLAARVPNGATVCLEELQKISDLP